MDMVEGRIFWDATLPGIEPAERHAIFDSMNATIARPHGIDPVAAGLEDFGRTGNYFARQIARWAGQCRQDERAGRDGLPNLEYYLAFSFFRLQQRARDQRRYRNLRSVPEWGLISPHAQ